MTFRTASEGYWVIFLIPLAIYLQDEHRIYKPVLVVILLNSIIISLFQVLKLDFGTLLPNLQKMNVVLALSTFLFCVEKGVNYAFPFFFMSLVKIFPKSFTLGEAILVTQAFFISFWAATMTMMKVGEVNEVAYAGTAVIVAHAGFLACLIICRLLLFITKPWAATMLDLLYCGWVLAVIVVFTLQISISQFQYLYQWVLQLFTEPTRVKLIVTWLVLTVAAIGFAVFKNYASSVVTTSDRKYFHFIVLLVFLPGVIVDYSLIFICSVAATCAFLILEVTRILRVKLCYIPVGDIIENSVSIFRDKQDEGVTILTPIYLMAGCSVPIWLNLIDPKADIGVMSDGKMAAALAGVMSIAVGDTFASICGSMFGQVKWKGSNKTIEGTLFSIMAQCGFVFILWFYGFGSFSTISVSSLVIAAVMNAFVEAKTDQIDNLVLPLLTYIAIVGVQRALQLYASRTGGIFGLF